MKDGFNEFHLEDNKGKNKLNLEPGETIEGEFSRTSLPTYLSAINSVSESIFLLTPLFIAIYTQDYHLFSLYWLETTVLPAISLVIGLFFVHYYTNKKLSKGTKYIVTNRRVLRSRRRNLRKLQSMRLLDIGMITVTRGRRMVNVTFTNSFLAFTFGNRIGKDAISDREENWEIKEYNYHRVKRIILKRRTGNDRLSNVDRGSDPILSQQDNKRKFRVRPLYSPLRQRRQDINTGLVQFYIMKREDADQAVELVKTLYKKTANEIVDI